MAFGVAVTVDVVSSEDELEVVAVELDVVAAELDVVAAIGVVVTVWCVPCCASTALSAATPATLIVARVAVAVVARRMPSARAVMSISLCIGLFGTDRVCSRQPR